MTRGLLRRARRLRIAALAVGISLLTSGCFFTTAKWHERTDPETRPYFCNAVGDGTPLGGHGNGSHVEPIYDGMTKGELSWEDCRQLGQQFDAAWASTRGLRTRGEAEAVGWRQLAEYIPGLGTHHAKDLFGGLTAPFDPAEPGFLIYGGAGPEAPLVGLSYVLPGTSEPPEAFAGTNDWWHLHQKICYGANGQILAGAEEIPDEECAALGGRQRDLGPGLWLLHLWIVPRYQLKLDVFASGHPCLGEAGPLPWDDECWELANRDPADGLPPGHGHEPTTTTTAPPGTTVPPTSVPPTTTPPTTAPPLPTTTVTPPPTTTPPTTVPPTTTPPTTPPTTTAPPTTHDPHGHDH